MNTIDQHLTNFNLKDFRKGQRSIIESVVSGNDTMAVMPTGGGKSLCYQLPALHLQGLVIVISPLIALMKDQVSNLKKLGLPAGCLYSGQSREEKKQVFVNIQNSEKYILYLSPERVQNPGFARWVQSQKLSLFAIDEAHCVSQWGPDFRKDYNKLQILRQLRPKVPVLALTATATPEVLSDVAVQLSLKDPKRHVYGFYRPNLYYQIEICQDEEEKLSYLLGAVSQTPEGKILIYCGTRKQTEQLADWLSSQFANVSYYHAGLDSQTRQDIQERMAQGKIRILTSTNAFGMGIDYSNVRLVVHFQMPANIESFYQEMGRAGRDGLPSTCLLLYAKKDRGLHSFFIQRAQASQSVISRRWRSLDAMTDFVESDECRHAGILTYFKDEERIERCGFCDICLPGSEAKKHAQALPRKKLVKRVSKKKKQDLQGLVLKDTGAKERHDKLKVWRKNYAKENDVPAFVIFSNKSLIDLSNKNPDTLSEMEAVHGFGKTKVSQIGQKVLECLKS